jgi:hypothetical protein
MLRLRSANCSSEGSAAEITGMVTGEATAARELIGALGSRTASSLVLGL